MSYGIHQAQSIKAQVLALKAYPLVMTLIGFLQDVGLLRFLLGRVLTTLSQWNPFYLPKLVL